MAAIENLVIDIQSMAHDMGDDYGFEDSTVEYIASEFQISTAEVREILSENDAYIDDDSYDEYNDGQPTEMEEWLDFDPDC